MQKTADVIKTISICQQLQSMKMTPKEFMECFITSADPDIAYQRQFWATDTGVDSTIALVTKIRNRLVTNPTSCAKWQDFIEEETIKILVKATSTRGSGTGNYQDLPLLYGILMGVLTSGKDATNVDNDPTSTPASKLPANPFEAQLLDCEGTAYIPAPCIANHWAHHLAATMVNDYLHKLGLTSCLQTALDALQTLTEQGQKDLKQVMSLEQASDLGPFICINNLDMKEKVHMASVGHQTSMLHGTWGYVQLPNKSLLDSLDASQLNLKTYLDAIKDVPNISIDPQQFMPTQEASNHYYHVWTSQIAHAMSTCVSLPADKRGAISTEPPVIEQVSCNVPPIYMLKLMDESDNSAKGIGQVLEALQTQTGLSPEDFSRCLQPMDGDLGTIQNFNLLCDLRHPSAFPQHGLNNIVFQLGGSHTTWNIAQAILTAHIGDPPNANDLGMWQLLEALGIPHKKVIQKKDFTLMLQHRNWSIWQLSVIACVTLDNLLGTLPTDKWNDTIIKCYERFCLPQARAKAAKEKTPKLHNLLTRLQEFSTVIEANNATKAGDVGRLMNVWKIWCVMSQGLKGLTHYSAYLPRMVIPLNELSPKDLSKLLQHNLLISPSRRPSHSMPKGNFLDTQNYWLKHFYNQGGAGTEIQCLKKLVSVNIILVDMGKQRIHQNRKVTLTLQWLQIFSQMANGKDILDSIGTKQASNQVKINNSFKEDVEEVNESNGEEEEEDGEDTDEEL
ncbi:hypothetical protein PCASD_21295 [Puccinia coronata f. sp. avenae]|uniref:DUF6589 domain-containing protein n=1 Tax=Puccinia coronata f. sp. avenae TaxID=200324 RepID=A0A2N5TX52_9BASI|nr:hypothetical protein PCASD_21295 [Puccinia coronata f. sp. avenae]